MEPGDARTTHIDVLGERVAGAPEQRAAGVQYWRLVTQRDGQVAKVVQDVRLDGRVQRLQRVGCAGWKIQTMSVCCV